METECITGLASIIDIVKKDSNLILNGPKWRKFRMHIKRNRKFIMDTLFDSVFEFLRQSEDSRDSLILVKIIHEFMKCSKVWRMRMARNMREYVKLVIVGGKPVEHDRVESHGRKRRTTNSGWQGLEVVRLPPPIADELQSFSCSLIEFWMGDYGHLYPQFRWALDYVKRVKKIHFDCFESRRKMAIEAQYVERYRQNLLRAKYRLTLREFADKELDLVTSLQTLNDLITLVIPDIKRMLEVARNDDEDDDDEWEDVTAYIPEDNYIEEMHGTTEINLEHNFDTLRTNENELIFQVIEEQMVAIHKQYANLLNEWIHVLTNYKPEEFQRLEHSQALENVSSLFRQFEKSMKKAQRIGLSLPKETKSITSDLQNFQFHHLQSVPSRRKRKRALSVVEKARKLMIKP